MIHHVQYLLTLPFRGLHFCGVSIFADKAVGFYHVYLESTRTSDFVFACVVTVVMIVNHGQNWIKGT